MATKREWLKGSVEVFETERNEEAGVTWDPSIHTALGFWQIGRRSSLFGFLKWTVPDVSKISAIAETAIRYICSDSDTFHIACGSYWDLSKWKRELEAGGTAFGAEVDDRLGGSRWALEVAGVEALTRAIGALWRDCHSFIVYPGSREARDQNELLLSLDSASFRFSLEPGDSMVLVRLNHPEDFLLIVQRSRCGPDCIDALRRIVEVRG